MTNTPNETIVSKDTEKCSTTAKCCGKCPKLSRIVKGFICIVGSITLLCIISLAIFGDRGQGVRNVLPTPADNQTHSAISANKEIALGVSKAIMNGDWDTVDNLLDPSFIYDGDGMRMNKDQYMGFMQDLYLSMRDMKMEFPQVIEEGEFVAIRFVNPMKNLGSFMGGPASGKTITSEGIFIRQIRNGKVIKENQSTDLVGIMGQIGPGALFGYTMAVGVFDLKTPIVRKTTAEMKKLDAELKAKGK